MLVLAAGTCVVRQQQLGRGFLVLVSRHVQRHQLLVLLQVTSVVYAQDDKVYRVPKVLQETAHRAWKG